MKSIKNIVLFVYKILDIFNLNFMYYAIIDSIFDFLKFLKNRLNFKMKKNTPMRFVIILFLFFHLFYLYFFNYKNFIKFIKIVLTSITQNIIEIKFNNNSDGIIKMTTHKNIIFDTIQQFKENKLFMR